MEHSISEDVERRLVERFGPGGACPHGNQINRSAAERRKLGLQQLWEAVPDSPLRVESMYERDRRLLEYLDGLGIRPGIGLEILTRNYDGTLTLPRISRMRVSIRSEGMMAFWLVVVIQSHLGRQNGASGLAACTATVHPSGRGYTSPHCPPPQSAIPGGAYVALGTRRYSYASNLWRGI